MICKLSSELFRMDCILIEIRINCLFLKALDIKTNMNMYTSKSKESLFDQIQRNDISFEMCQILLLFTLQIHTFLSIPCLAQGH